MSNIPFSWHLTENICRCEICLLSSSLLIIAPLPQCSAQCIIQATFQIHSQGEQLLPFHTFSRNLHSLIMPPQRQWDSSCKHLSSSAASYGHFQAISARTTHIFKYRVLWIWDLKSFESHWPCLFSLHSPAKFYLPPDTWCAFNAKNCVVVGLGKIVFFFVSVTA